MRVYFTSLGCRLNQAEIESFERDAWRYHLEVTDDLSQADWAVINTCAVTSTAAQKTRQAVRRLRERHPGIRVAVTGCYATLNPDDLTTIDGVELALPNALKQNVLAEIRDYSAPCLAQQIPSQGAQARRTRAQLKIQDGCDNHCTYCVVRIARGAQRSIAPQDVLQQVQERVAEGYKEVVLTGVHIGAYGRDSAPNAPLPENAGWTLARLVGTLLEQTAIPRLRISSVEPQDATDGLLALWPNERLCRHLHLPLQSGSDAVLRRMGRHYSSADVVRLVGAIRKRVPEMAISTDVITGFPGETDAEHAETCALLQHLGLARLHVFVYSPRPGTEAAEMPDQVLPETARQRSQQLIALGADLALAYSSRYLGRKVRVLFERSHNWQGDCIWSGLTDNYLRVYTRAEKDLHNKFVDVRCNILHREGLLGELASGI